MVHLCEEWRMHMAASTSFCVAADIASLIRLETCLNTLAELILCTLGDIVLQPSWRIQIIQGFKDPFHFLIASSCDQWSAGFTMVLAEFEALFAASVAVATPFSCGSHSSQHCIQVFDHNIVHQTILLGASLAQKLPSPLDLGFRVGTLRTPR